MKILEKEIWSEPARIAEVIDFLKVCSEYDPDDTPMWFLAELEEDDEEMDSWEAHSAFRDRYGSDTDTDTVRMIFHRACRILGDADYDRDELIRKMEADREV